MSLRHAALGLLAQEPGSGYDLLRRFETTMANVWPATQSQLYTELNRLTADGLIEVTGTGARGRKDYAITAAGRAELRDWMLAPVATPMRNPNLLKVFLLGELSPDEASAFVRGRLERSRGELDALTAIRDTTDWTRADLHSRLALDYGLRVRRAEVEWAEAALRDQEEADSPEKPEKNAS